MSYKNDLFYLYLNKKAKNNNINKCKEIVSGKILREFVIKLQPSVSRPATPPRRAVLSNATVLPQSPAAPPSTSPPRPQRLSTVAPPPKSPLMPSSTDRQRHRGAPSSPLHRHSTHSEYPSSTVYFTSTVPALEHSGRAALRGTRHRSIPGVNHRPGMGLAKAKVPADD